MKTDLLGRRSTRWLPKTVHAVLLCLAFSSVSAVAETHEIEIKRMKFRTPLLTVNVGDTVVWVNKEYRQYHSVWFEQEGEPEPIDYLYPGDTYSRTFDQAGTYPYRCGPHPKMIGVIEVLGAPAS